MTAPATKTKAKAAAAADAPICDVCWPDGWPTPDTDAASCIHGQWSRTLPSA